MKAANGGDDALTAEEIRAALEHIVVSSSFRRSPQLVAFLRFVVELTLGGNAKYIKSYTIAVEALGRGERFDPQVDPIVRVEAARIRRALANYFAGEGSGLPITIEIPLGAYVPVFRRRTYDRSIATMIAVLMRTLSTMRVPSQTKLDRFAFFRARRQSRTRASRSELGRASTR